MNIVDFPRRAQRSLYESATQAYAAKVAGRARAVYRTGNINFPGLSDLDLLVVPSCRRADNAQYFSALHRLPAPYHHILLHDPFVIPAEQKAVLRYTTHRNLQLLAGEDVFADVAFVDTAAEDWCKLLEGYCSYAAFVKSVASSGQVRGRRLVPKASSLRFSLRQMDALSGSSYAPEYERIIDEMRGRYYASDPVSTLLTMWEVFNDAYRTLESWLSMLLPLEHGEAVDDFIRRLFCGRAYFKNLSSEYVLARSADIDEYYEAVARLHIPYGQIFFWEAHYVRAHKHEQSGLANVLYRIKYKIERALTPAPAI
jgi:hypothetical protein